MGYSLDAKQARQADQHLATIREAGKYIGTITRAEAITSQGGTTGMGLSFAADDGATANYLDQWTHKDNGEALYSLKTVNAILAVLKLREVKEGEIVFEKYDKDSGQRVKVKAKGYPDIQGKRIGFLLRQTLETNSKTGADREGVEIYGVFQADTELTASEVLDKATKPEKLSKMLDALIARPVNDRRKKPGSAAKPASSASAGGGFDDMDDDIPF